MLGYAMFRTAELGQTLSKEEYKHIEPVLRQELLDLQMELRAKAKFPVIIVFAGVDGAGPMPRGRRVGCRLR